MSERGGGRLSTLCFNSRCTGATSLGAANRRYLEFLSAIEDPRTGRHKLNKLSRTVQQDGRSYPGFNLFDADDDILLRSIARGEFNISGLQNKTETRSIRTIS